MNRRSVWILTITSAFLLFLLSVGFGVRSEASEAPSLRSTTSAEIGESFALRLGFDPGTAAMEDFTLVVSRRNGDETIHPTGDAFLISLDPEELTIDLKPRLMNGTTEVDARTTPYSGALYVKALAESGLMNAVAKTMLADLLEYGAAAQAYFNFRTEDPANAETYRWDGYQPSQFTAPTVDAASPANTGTGIAIQSANLYLLGDTLAVQFRGVANDTAAFTLNGNAVSVQPAADGSFVVRADAVMMSKLTEAVYTLNVSDGTNASEISYGVANYIANKTNASYEANGNSYMFALAKRLWAYGCSAKAFQEFHLITDGGADSEEIWGPLY